MKTLPCERCGKQIPIDRLVWLELDGVDSVYRKPGEIPPWKSQGGFPFGKDCAKAALAACQADDATEETP